MKFIVTSDLHGNLPKIETEFDLMVICGDICPAHDHYTVWQYMWVLDVFCEWVCGLPFKDEKSKVFFTWGNHDFFDKVYYEKRIENAKGDPGYEIPDYSNEYSCIETIGNDVEHATNGRAVLLNNQMGKFELDGKTVTLFGCPYCKKFYNWAFMRNNGNLKHIYSAIPEGVDILFTHDPANLNDMGTITQGYGKGKNAGNDMIAEELKRIRPKYYFAGHIHSGNHNPTEIDGMLAANVSLVDENYNVTYQPLVLDI